MTYWYEG